MCLIDEEVWRGCKQLVKITLMIRTKSIYDHVVKLYNETRGIENKLGTFDVVQMRIYYLSKTNNI